jgi:hypothetical protein
MNKNLISSDDVDLLFDKLVSGNLVIIAVLSSLIGFRLQFTGILDKKLNRKRRYIN